MEDRLCYTHSFPKYPVRGTSLSSVRASDGREVTLMTQGDVSGARTWALCEPCVYLDALPPPLQGISLPSFLFCDGGLWTQQAMDYTRPECSP